jgi:hypothetical protein
MVRGTTGMADGWVWLVLVCIVDASHHTVHIVESCMHISIYLATIDNTPCTLLVAWLVNSEYICLALALAGYSRAEEGAVLRHH